MLKVGLTGGIAIGKSFVAKVLAEQGCRVFDADQIAREVVKPGAEGYKKVIAEFGKGILAPDGTIDRVRLGQIVFANESKRKRLNAILHPIIIAEQDWLLAEVEAEDHDAIAVVDAPLMIESGSYKRFEKIIVVYCDRETQLERLMRRNKFTREEAEARLAAQMPTEEKRKYADFEIDTTGDFDQTRKKVIEVYKKLKDLARAK
jgi:dephospho-CoA kinase